MKYINLNMILLAAYFLLPEVSHAQFALTGEIRPRTEFSHGYKSLSFDNQDWSIATTQRTRLNALYATRAVDVKISLQDVRYWGSQPQLVANEDYATSVHEAWAQVELANNFFLKAGRQELVYDDHRILGNVGWAQQARSHDLALFKYENNIKLHAGIAHHENGDITNNFYGGPDAYKDLQFVWFNKAAEKYSVSLLFLNNGVPYFEAQEEKVRYSQTIGGHFEFKTNLASLAANAYYQTGTHVSGLDINAYNFLIEAALANGFLAGYEYLSGTPYNEDDQILSFNPLYGTNHKFNGFMDYFYVGNHFNSVGLQDAFLSYSLKWTKFSANATLHYFAAAAEMAPDAGKYLGTELDLTLGYKISDAAAFTAGWSTMFAHENMSTIKMGNPDTGNHWAYLMLTVTPAFLKL